MLGESDLVVILPRGIDRHKNRTALAGVYKFSVRFFNHNEGKKMKQSRLRLKTHEKICVASHL